MSLLLRRKYVTIDWGGYTFAKRKWRFRHNRRVHSVYTQVGPLEIVMWYR